MRIVAVLLLSLVTAFAHATVSHARADRLHAGVKIGKGLALDIHAPARANQRRFFKRTRVPVIVYVHGGGWIKGDRSKVYDLPSFASRRGWMLVSLSYHPVPRVTVGHQVLEIEHGVRWVQRNIKRYGGDPTRIVLMGHSAGSHLVSMVGARGKIRGLRGVVANDVQAYDMHQYARLRGNGLPHMYAKAFGLDGRNWKRWSPITYVKAARRRPPPHLIMYSDGGIYQRRRTLSRTYGRALAKKGAKVRYFDGRGFSHGALGARIGRAHGKPMTRAVETFLREAFR